MGFFVPTCRVEMRDGKCHICCHMAVRSSCADPATRSVTPPLYARLLVSCTSLYIHRRGCQKPSFIRASSVDKTCRSLRQGPLKRTSAKRAPKLCYNVDCDDAVRWAQSNERGTQAVGDMHHSSYDRSKTHPRRPSETGLVIVELRCLIRREVVDLSVRQH